MSTDSKLQVSSKLFLQIVSLSAKYPDIRPAIPISESIYWFEYYCINRAVLEQTNIKSKNVNDDLNEGAVRAIRYLSHVLLFLELITEHTRLSDISSESYNDHQRAKKLKQYCKETFANFFKVEIDTINV